MVEPEGEVLLPQLVFDRLGHLLADKPVEVAAGVASVRAILPRGRSDALYDITVSHFTFLVCAAAELPRHPRARNVRFMSAFGTDIPRSNKGEIHLSHVRFMSA